MAVTIRRLFRNAEKNYQAKLIAGENGLNRLGEWTHIVEDAEVACFLHGQEIVFTAGLLYKGDEWLLEFTKALFDANTSAFVINCGPYISQIPDSVIKFCDDNDFPLYTIPWKIRMVDMTRNFCQEIIENSNNETKAASLFKDILFGVGNEETLWNLERMGYAQDYSYNFICVSLETEYGTNQFQDEVDFIKRTAEKLAKKIHEKYLSFRYQEKIYLTLVGYEDDEIMQFVDKFFKELSKFKVLQKVHIGVGENLEGLLQQKQNFDNAVRTNELAIKRRERILYYDELGVSKLLFAIGDEKLLVRYYNDTVGKLKTYDEENDSNLFEFMKNYLECEGSPQAVSEKMYIHRNTVNNYLRKVEKVLDIGHFGLEEKMKLYFGYLVAELCD